MSAVKPLWELPALSVRQPWAELIVRGLKDVENRTWRNGYRGPVLIHAGQTSEINEAGGFVADLIKSRQVEGADGRFGFLLKGVWGIGAVVGVAEITDCVTSSASPWFVGPYGFTLKNARKLPSVRCRGMLGFFNPAVQEREMMRRHWEQDFKQEARKP